MICRVWPGLLALSLLVVLGLNNFALPTAEAVVSRHHNHTVSRQITEDGIWHTDLPGLMPNLTGNSSIPVTLHVWMKGICVNDSILIRGQALVSNIQHMQYGYGGVDLFQPPDILAWQPTMYLSSESHNTTFSPHRMMAFKHAFPNEHGEKGVPAPLSFNASLPSTLIHEEMEFSVLGWPRVQTLHPASDFQLHCHAPDRVANLSGMELVHVLPPVVGAPTQQTLQVLKQQVTWDRAIGVVLTLIHVTKAHRYQLDRDPNFQAWQAAGHVRLNTFDNFYSCKSNVYCLKRLAWTYSLVYLWDSRERWALMSDVDEFLALPLNQSAGSFLADNLKGAAVAEMTRVNAICIDCSADATSDVEAFETDFPLSHYACTTFVIANTSVYKPEPKTIVSTHQAYAFGIHTGYTDGVKLHLDRSSQAFVLHLPNLFRHRTAFNMSADIFEERTWLRAAGRLPPARVR